MNAGPGLEYSRGAGPPALLMNSTPNALTALLVDDEAYFRRFVGQLLRSEGFSKIVEAKDGHEAIDLWQAVRPDLIVLDINMPRMDGLEALRALRKLAGDRPIIMLTSIADEAIVEQCVDIGATFFIRKDVPAQQLSAAMREVLTDLGDGSSPAA